jgi:hypothetical protein
LSEENTIQWTLAVNTEMTYSEIHKLELTLIRTLAYAQQLTGDPNLKKGIQTIQSTIIALKTLQQTMRAVELASGPIGWAYAAITAVAAGASMGNMMMQLGE